VTRHFIPRSSYDGYAWVALVHVEGASSPYYRGARLTRLGARFAARRRARKLNRLEAKGLAR
jgi:hypothetical protein